MGAETRPWDAAEFLDGPEVILAYLEAVFEDGDPELIALALNNVARAKGLQHDALTAQSDIASFIAALKAPGLELTARAARVSGAAAGSGMRRGKPDRAKVTVTSSALRCWAAGDAVHRAKDRCPLDGCRISAGGR